MIELVGINHRGQHARGNMAENYAASLATRFKRINPVLIGEEATAEGLKLYGVESTVPMKAAATLQIEHRFCEIGLREREQLGWKSIKDFPNVDEYRAYSDPLREQRWFERIQDRLDFGNVVFVCGQKHVYNFAMRLASHGYEVHFTLADLDDRNPKGL